MRRARTAKIRSFFKAILVVAIFISISALINLGRSGSTSSNPYVNIKQLPDSFMKQYLSDYAELSSNNKQNILIVASLKPLENTYGAKNIIKAANNQYFLEFASSEEKDFAYEQISHNPELTVSKNTIRTFTEEDENSGLYNSWGIEKMGLDHAKELVDGYSGKSDVVVAILDTGLDKKLFNESFEGKLAGTYSVITNNEKVTDNVGHGTHIAGTIAEGTPDNVKILPVKISEGREMYSTDIIAAIDYAVYYGDADVINMSFGGYIYEDAEYLAVEAAKENNVISVAAAGNESTSERSFPSSFDNTISISAVDSDLRFADFSNYGTMVDFAAPGVDIVSINGDMSGTSMATPHAVAAVAIAKSFNKNFTQEEVIELLKTRAEDLGANGKDSKFGWGFIDFNGAKLCTNSSEYCDDFSVFEIDSQTGIEVVEPILTPYNYGSLTNILATKIKINYASGASKEKALGDFGDNISITGYDPFTAGEQTITVAYEDFTAVFTVENPNDWQNGWTYDTYNNKAALREYIDHKLDIKTLYLPEKIDNIPVTSTSAGCLFRGNDESIGITQCEYPQSEDSYYYETLVIPESYEFVWGFSGGVQVTDQMFQNLYKIVYLGDELTVGNMAFAYLRNLVSVSGKIKFASFTYGDLEGNTYERYESSAFAGDTSLVDVTIADSVTAIPEATFSECTSLEHIDLPDSVTTIEERAFEASGIRVLELGSSVKTIKNMAFSRSKLEEIYIPAATTEIESQAFKNTDALYHIEIDTENPVYDSRDSSNAIILTAEDKLIVGTYNTVIPESVKIIGEDSFRESGSLGWIEVPEGVETIEANAFSQAPYLQKIIMPRSLTSIDPTAFEMSGIGTPSRTVFWVWSNSYAKDFVFEHDYPYVLMDNLEEEPEFLVDAAFETIPDGREFMAMDTFSAENFIIKVYYYDEENNKLREEPEIVTDYNVIYNGGDSEALVGGNNTATFVFNTATGYQNIKIDLYVFAKYLTPEYEVPTGITAYSGQALSEIELPEGFTWMDDGEFVDENQTEYLARFTPEDPINYAIIPDIPITITVKVGTTLSEIFPDDVLRACVVENYNTQNSTEFTEETLDVTEALKMTELNCAGNDDNKVTNARGIERMTELESLNLSGNSIEKINLSKNEKLESADLRGNSIANLDVTNNPNLSELLIDESGLEGEELIIVTSTYAEIVYSEDNTSSLTMNISELGFLKNSNFTVVGINSTYDAENGVITFITEDGFEKVRIDVLLDNGETISYSIYAFPRYFYVTNYVDGEPYDVDMQLFFTYTGAIFDMRELGEMMMDMYGLIGYEVEDITISGAEDEYTVGTSDVHVSFHFAKKQDEDDDPTIPVNPTDPDNPGTSDTPTDPSASDEPGITTNPQTSSTSMMLPILVIISSTILLIFERRIFRSRR